MKFYLKIAFLFFIFLNSANSSDYQAPKIISSINPVYQIVNSITGDDKNNVLLINPRASEHEYQLKPSDVNKINNADVVFYISDDLEIGLQDLISKAKNQTKIIPLIKTKGLKLLIFQLRPGENTADAHIWLNPENAILMARNIADILSQLNPDGAATYQKNLEQFVVDVRNMDDRNRLELIKVRPKSFMSYHNGISYFEDYYQVKSAGVMTYYPNQILTIEDVKKINNKIKQSGISCLISTPQEINDIPMQLALNNKIKFSLADIVGNQMNYQQNGYVKMMTDFVDELTKCSKH